MRPTPLPAQLTLVTMPMRISEYERRTLIQQALDFYISYIIRNEFPLLTRESYSEDVWFHMLINGGFQH